MKQLILDVRPDFTPSLDNFVPGDNAALVAALREHIARRDGSVLYIWGAPGSGRTHLLQACASAAAASRLVSTALDETPAGALVCVDDVEQRDEAALGALFRLLIRAREAQQSVLIAGNAPPAVLPLRDDVSSRIAQGLVFEIRPLTDDQKRETLVRHAESRGMQLAPGVVAYLLRRSRRDLPWLMAVLDALDEASLSLGRPITLPLLREILRPD